MKKNLLSMFALATMLLATGCSQDEELVNESNELVEVSFNLKSSEGPQSRAISDGKKAQELFYGVFDQNGNVIPTQHGKTTMDDPTTGTTVTFKLVKGQTYDFVFWAQTPGNKYYNVNPQDLTEISVNYNTDANDEDRDAFFGKELDYTVEGRFTKTVKLTRPFGQLNVGTTIEDYNTATTLLSGKGVNKSKLVVKNLPNTLNLLTGKLGESVTEEAVFSLAALPTDAGNDYEILAVDIDKNNQIAENEKYVHLSMNYLLAAEESAIHEVDITFANGDTDADVINTINITNAPIQRNYRTNILGQILTTEGDFTIYVDPVYVDDHNYFLSEYTVASTEELVEVLEQLNDANYTGPTNVTINLAADVEWATGESHNSTPLLTTDSKIKSLTIDGKDQYSLTATGSGVGEIRAANGATIIFKDMKIEDESKSYAESSWEFGYLEFAGSLKFENVEFVNAIMICGATSNNSTAGNAVFVDCTFNSNVDSEYAVWVSGQNASFTNCKFTGPRGLKMHEAYGSEVTEILVDACEFGPLSQKPGVVIGTVNPATTVTIKNSVFVNCQAGDQKLYIYETDTDVTTFDFTEEDNTVITEPNANVVMDIKDLTDATTHVVLTEDVQVDKNNYIHTHTRTNDLTIYGNGNTIVSTATDESDFDWYDNYTKPYMSTLLSSSNASTITVNDLNFTGTMSALCLGHYRTTDQGDFKTILNNVNVIGAKVVSFSANIAPGVCTYGNVELNGCNIYGTLRTELETAPNWPIYDLAITNNSTVTIKGGKIGSIYSWAKTKIEISEGAEVESIIPNGNMNTNAQYGIVIKSGTSVGLIDLTNITNKSKAKFEIESGATVGKIVANGAEYNSIEEWQAAN